VVRCATADTLWVFSCTTQAPLVLEVYNINWPRGFLGFLEILDTWLELASEREKESGYHYAPEKLPNAGVELTLQPEVACSPPTRLCVAEATLIQSAHTRTSDKRHVAHVCTTNAGARRNRTFHQAANVQLQRLVGQRRLRTGDVS